LKLMWPLNFVKDKEQERIERCARKGHNR